MTQLNRSLSLSRSSRTRSHSLARHRSRSSCSSWWIDTTMTPSTTSVRKVCQFWWNLVDLVDRLLNLPFARFIRSFSQLSASRCWYHKWLRNFGEISSIWMTHYLTCRLRCSFEGSIRRCRYHKWLRKLIHGSHRDIWKTRILEVNLLAEETMRPFIFYTLLVQNVGNKICTCSWNLETQVILKFKLCEHPVIFMIFEIKHDMQFAFHQLWIKAR